MMWLVLLYLPVTVFGSGIRECFLDDSVPLLHLMSRAHDETFISSTDASLAAESAVARTEEILKQAVQAVRRKRGNRDKRVTISGSDYFSLSAKRVLEAARRETTAGDIIPVLFGVMDLILFAVLYMAKPEWHCQPFLMLYWWISGVIVMTTPNPKIPKVSLTAPQALSMLVQMASTVGYGSHPPRSAELMFYHAIHSSAGIAAGITEVMSSLADYVIDNMDRVLLNEAVRIKNPSVLCEAIALRDALIKYFDKKDANPMIWYNKYKSFMDAEHQGHGHFLDEETVHNIKNFEERVQKWKNFQSRLAYAIRVENKK